MGTDIPQREDDGPIAIYAKQHGCDILTADIKAYSEYLRSGIKRVQIEEFAYNEASDAYIYLVKILDWSFLAEKNLKLPLAVLEYNKNAQRAPGPPLLSK